MKKILHIFSLLLCCVFLAGCGRKEDTQQENVRQEDMQQGDVNQKDAQGKEAQQNNDLTEYIDILSDLRTFFRSENSAWEKSWVCSFIRERQCSFKHSKIETIRKRQWIFTCVKKAVTMRYC